MRVLVLLGLGLPVAAVSAAVAYGSISQISQSFKSYRSPVVAGDLLLSETIPARPSEAARDFILASAGSWDIAPIASQDRLPENGAGVDHLQLAQMMPAGPDDAPAGTAQAPLPATDATATDAPATDALPAGGDLPAFEFAAEPDVAPELDMAVVTERPVARPPLAAAAAPAPLSRPVAQNVIRPRVVVSADRSSAEELRARRATSSQNRKREFRMPWQTGIFQ